MSEPIWNADREIGRQALGCHGGVANEAVQGELGWSSFEAREATSKITYYGRLRHMDSCRWARRLFMYTHLTGPADMLAEAPSSTLRRTSVTTRPNNGSDDAQTKKTLQVYLTHTTIIASEALLYDNSLGSRLLSEAHAGASGH
ncbi:hypothetical protein HPB47_001976 [Ixodes persulcatus]|uniref:Uncharacterized protein n=1 Tax=Ixodes persulcatus TaxID=34615 RepID=A0AC60PMR1_IXOPE|nr:hypothetical protein HPB47_001976 [Ixodes persulcatus]